MAAVKLRNKPSVGWLPLILFSTSNLTTTAQLVDLPQEVVINSGRPTFYTPGSPLSGKIALEEHVGNTLFSGVYTPPPVNFTNEPAFDLAIYDADVSSRLNDIDTRVAAMNAANISMSVVIFGAPGIHGIFNTTFATIAATYVNDEAAQTYNHGSHSSRFDFWCSNALQDPISAAAELERCVKHPGGVDSFVGGYTNNGSENSIISLDDPVNDVFLAKVAELDVPIHLHLREAAPNQHRVYQDYSIMAGSPWGFAAEIGAHALRIMMSGVLDTYPNLKIILGHCGEGLPFFMPRIESRLRHAIHSYPAKQNLTYYWNRNFYVTTSGIQSKAVLDLTLASLGEDRVMLSVDYPFEDDVELGTWFDRIEMSVGAKEKIASENARNILKLR
ncbi:hypothetical protein LTR78_010736 [Recurvomyces mirabilis]|uniref:Amidohydrolase-related domain-containing protein n=1 Tax=Recurvomyces mirabilis TaxID=574656 RepID=A0AAE0TRJ9_9PEZI|nr:hypothetical protein LTR78_010736 [Recurvomyces mirabilis]KAK5152538.1 hypothetical protein LTS14_008485 [Recurvomyces mirabilis]